MHTLSELQRRLRTRSRGVTLVWVYINSILAKDIEIYGTGEIHVTHGYETNNRGQEVYLAE